MKSYKRVLFLLIMVKSMLLAQDICYQISKDDLQENLDQKEDVLIKVDQLFDKDVKYKLIEIFFDTSKYIPYTDIQTFDCMNDEIAKEKYECVGDDDGGRMKVFLKENTLYYHIEYIRMAATTDDPVIYHVESKSMEPIKAIQAPCVTEKRINALKDKLTVEFKEKRYADALYTFARIETLGIALPSSFAFFKAKAEYLSGESDIALEMFKMFMKSVDKESVLYKQTQFYVHQIENSIVLKPLYVCYGSKSIKYNDQMEYTGCMRSDKVCHVKEKRHFGKYMTEEAAMDALQRCKMSTPKISINDSRYVCYNTKSMDYAGETVYHGCIRQNDPCETKGERHFGKYTNEEKTSGALRRCQNSNPRFKE